ncbi:MAG: DUF938 domain-containing protein [Sphingomonadaceae bacterium]
MSDARAHAPATLRNREPILERLQAELPPSGTVLEVASGSGEHAIFFAAALPSLRWQPSDPDPAARASITAWAATADLPNLAPPLDLDVMAPAWPIERADAVVAINLLHISPWAATTGLLEGAARLLAPGAPLLVYGPFLEDGVETAPSNLDFDSSLKARNPAWGLRRVEAVAQAAAPWFDEPVRHAMPANNLTLLFRRR